MCKLWHNFEAKKHMSTPLQELYWVPAVSDLRTRFEMLESIVPSVALHEMFQNSKFSTNFQKWLVSQTYN